MICENESKESKEDEDVYIACNIGKGGLLFANFYLQIRS